MAWAFVQEAHAKGGNAVSSITVQLPANWTNGNRIVVITEAWRSGNVGAASVSDNGPNSWTAHITNHTNTDNAEQKVWSQQVNSTPGTNPTITVTMDSSTGYLTVLAMEFSGLDTSGSPVDASGTNSGNSSTASATTSGNVSAAGELGLALYADAGWGQTVAPHTGYTTRSSQPYVSGSGMPEHASSLDANPTSGSTWQAQTDLSRPTGWGEIAAVFKLAASGPTTDQLEAMWQQSPPPPARPWRVVDYVGSLRGRRVHSGFPPRVGAQQPVSAGAKGAMQWVSTQPLAPAPPPPRPAGRFCRCSEAPACAPRSTT